MSQTVISNLPIQRLKLDMFTKEQVKIYDVIENLYRVSGPYADTKWFPTMEKALEYMRDPGELFKERT
jgi:hypothetical protein